MLCFLHSFHAVFVAPLFILYVCDPNRLHQPILMLFSFSQSVTNSLYSSLSVLCDRNLDRLHQPIHMLFSFSLSVLYDRNLDQLYQPILMLFSFSLSITDSFILHCPFFATAICISSIILSCFPARYRYPISASNPVALR